jgi:hypothetical protein
MGHAIRGQIFVRFGHGNFPKVDMSGDFTERTNSANFGLGADEATRPAFLDFDCVVCRPRRCGDLGAIFACILGSWVDFFSLVTFAMISNAPAQKHGKIGIRSSPWGPRGSTVRRKRLRRWVLGGRASEPSRTSPTARKWDEPIGRRWNATERPDSAATFDLDQAVALPGAPHETGRGGHKKTEHNDVPPHPSDHHRERAQLAY